MAACDVADIHVIAFPVTFSELSLTLRVSML